MLPSTPSCSAPSSFALASAEVLLCQLEWSSDVARWDPAVFDQRLEDNLSSCLQQVAWMDDTVLSDFVGLMLERRAQARDLQAAEEAYRRALTMEPNNHIARANLSRLLTKMQRVSDAATVLADAPPSVSLACREGYAWWSRAFYHMRMHHPSLSNQCFERALTLLNHPKLRFYAAKQLLRGKPDATRRKLAQRLLQPLRTPSFTPFFDLQVIAESIRADAVKNKTRQIAQVRDKLTRADAIATEHPAAREALRPVYNFAADSLNKAGETAEATRLYSLSTVLPGLSRSSFAAHHQAKLLPPAAQLVGLQQASAMQPSNLAARMDHIQAAADAGQWHAAVAAAAELLSDPALRLLNRARVRVLQGQSLLQLGDAAGARVSFESALPLLTGWCGGKPYQRAVCKANSAPSCSAPHSSNSRGCITTG